VNMEINYLATLLRNRNALMLVGKSFPLLVMLFYAETTPEECMPNDLYDRFDTNSTNT